MMLNDSDEPLLPEHEFDPQDLRLPAARPEFRAALGAETARLVRRRASHRRWGRAAQFALTYAAGVLTVLALWWNSTTAAPKSSERVAVAPRVAVPSSPAKIAPPTVAAVPRKQSNPAPIDERRLSPEQLRARVAGAPRAEQIRLLRLAGDRYLYDYEDVVMALHCYRQVLELDPPNARRPFDSDDSWLLAELKNARVMQARPHSPPEA